MDVVLPYVHQREQFGQRIGEFQLVQAKLADMYSTTQACRAFVYRLVALTLNPLWRTFTPPPGLPRLRVQARCLNPPSFLSNHASYICVLWINFKIYSLAC